MSFLLASAAQINEITGWMCGLIIAILTLRLIRDLYDAYNDADMGIKEVFRKGKRRIFASLIGIGAAGLVAFFQRYF